jgi:hypothetical protein
MAKKVNKPRPREIGRQKKEKKYLIDPRYKNLFWTVVFLVVLLVFFIVNNTRDVPESGPNPPGYDTQKEQDAISRDVPSELEIK